MTNSHFEAAPILVLGGNGKTGSRVATRLRDMERTVRAVSRVGATLRLEPGAACCKARKVST